MTTEIVLSQLQFSAAVVFVTAAIFILLRDLLAAIVASVDARSAGRRSAGIAALCADESKILCTAAAKILETALPGVGPGPAMRLALAEIQDAYRGLWMEDKIAPGVGEFLLTIDDDSNSPTRGTLVLEMDGFESAPDPLFPSAFADALRPALLKHGVGLVRAIWSDVEEADVDVGVESASERDSRAADELVSEYVALYCRTNQRDVNPLVDPAPREIAENPLALARWNKIWMKGKSVELKG